MFFVTGVGDQIEVLTVLPKFRKIRENEGFWSKFVINPKMFFSSGVFFKSEVGVIRPDLIGCVVVSGIRKGGACRQRGSDFWASPEK